jgi:FkbM family methyltransferase
MTTPIRAARAAGRMLSALGPYHLAKFFYARQFLRDGERDYQLTSPHARYPLNVRAGTSDFYVFYQIFGHREYRCLDSVEDARLIVDLGANVGYSAAYFLTRFPRATVICVEPDRANGEALRANLAPYGNRWRLVPSAVWSETCDLVFDDRYSGPREEWGRQVRPARPGENAIMRAVSVGSLWDEACSIVKMDVEGAEEGIFEYGVPEWLRRCGAIVVEVHSKKALKSVQHAFGQVFPTVTYCDELVVGLPS